MVTFRGIKKDVPRGSRSHRGRKTLFGDINDEVYRTALIGHGHFRSNADAFGVSLSMNGFDLIFSWRHILNGERAIGFGHRKVPVLHITHIGEHPWMNVAFEA